MHFSLEIQPTLRDFLQLASDRRSRWSLIVSRGIAALALLYGMHHYRANGLDWEFGLIIAFAVIVGAPFHVTYVLIWLVLAIRSPMIHVSIDANGICVRSNNHERDFPWSSFANLGSATEFENHFWLTCGRGKVWIPKRAMSTSGQLAGFRQFVTDKMGARCTFNVVECEHGC